jgi:predicted ester cyclase
MSAEENKAIFRRYVEEVGNEGKLELADEIFDRYLAHQPDGSVLERGPEDVKRFMGEFQEAFPDFHTEIEDQIAEGDKVVTRLTARGTQRGDLPGIPATGNEMCMTATVIHRIADGRLAEKWSDKDVLAMLQQLNVIPPLN